MLSRALVARLLELVGAVDIRLHRGCWILRDVPGEGRRRCKAYYGGNGTVEIVLNGRPASDVVKSLLHECLHAAGEDEPAVANRLDAAAYAHPVLRAAAALRLVDALRG